jgi:hypothetical protein
VANVYVSNKTPLLFCSACPRKCVKCLELCASAVCCRVCSGQCGPGCAHSPEFLAPCFCGTCDAASVLASWAASRAVRVFLVGV